MSSPRQPPEPSAAVPAWNCAGCRLCHLTPDRQLCRLRHLLRWLDARPAPPLLPPPNRPPTTPPEA
ncbi:hypothetical protein J7E24_01210 [Hymenobacter sp. ISL-91]|uniref:hypothetical protein n=1 Tax=Hymenobacter sp. ISL-91 TaxID=2819151 RepID=UPI001BE8D55A|nr:hypothetical protein [Hymenobacter sp. ISL-91]MBT2556394.1 hypothetical protein [Hymenobacter sp. ISL-91]